jgi:uncharacterized protein
VKKPRLLILPNRFPMLRFALGLTLFLFQSLCSWALEIPNLHERVTDLAGVLTPDQVTSLDAKLRDLETTDSTQVAVLIIPGLEGESLEDYSLRVVEAWKLGQKGRDNGALLFISMKDRKIRIEVGYGLEPTLTDARTNQIIRNDITPRFREGDFYGGVDAGITGIIQTVRGNYQPSPNSGSRTSRRKGGSLFNFIIVLLFPLFWILSSTGKWGGAIIGGGAGMLLPYTLLAHSLPLLLIGGVVGGGLGMLLGTLIRAGAGSGQGRGGFGGPFIPGGGGFGGFGSGGGGFGGGGGGFSGGGGSFGGGGSSGSW